MLFRKPRARLEIYNDVDDGLFNFFTVLRDRTDELVALLERTPYSRSEYEHCRDTWHLVEDPVERARRWFVRVRQSFGASASMGWGFEVKAISRSGSRARSFATAVDLLWRFAERLRGVQIEHLDWRACLDRYDGPGACFYLDPPYLPQTRGRDRHNAYRHDLTRGDHEELVDRVAALRGSVLLSGYESDLYRALDEAGFERFEFAHNSTISRALKGRGERTEVVWRRLEDGVADSLFSSVGAAA